MDKPLISVILTVYNGENYITESIESVLCQTYDNFELLVYDDGSVDGTFDIVQGFKDRRIRSWRSENNRHIAYGTNFLLNKCTGNYIAIVDADDIWTKDKLEKQMDFLTRNPQYDCCFSWCDLIDGSGRICNEEHKELYEMFQAQTNTREYWLRYFFFKGNKLCNPSAVFTASSAKAVGMHNLFYIQATDMEWWLRFVKKYSFAVIEEPLVRYRYNFGEKDKTSGLDEVSLTRYTNELECIRMNFFKDMDNELFISAFRDFFINKDAASPKELECEKLFLSLTPYENSSSIPASGMFMLENALSDPEFADYIFEKYGLTTRKAGEYTGTHIVNDFLLERYVNACRYIKALKQNDDIRLQHYKEKYALAADERDVLKRKLQLKE